MRDLTRGSIPNHLMALAVPMTLGAATQMLYLLVDLFFVAQLGDAAVAGVGSASTLAFLIMGCTQTISVGAAVGIAHAAGRGDYDRIRSLFVQALWIGTFAGLSTLIVGELGRNRYAMAFAADLRVQAAATDYLKAYFVGLALAPPMAAVTGLLRGIGDAGGIARVQMISLAANISLAPALITGVGRWHGFGVFGAGIATTLSGILSLVLMIRRALRHADISRGVRRVLAHPIAEEIRYLLRTGLPAGGENFVMYGNLALVFWAAGRWGTDAQAGAGIGVRVMQTLLVPALSIAYSAATVAGHNYGAKNHLRIQQTFRSALLIVTGLLATLTILCHYKASLLVRVFTQDPGLVRLADGLVRVMAISFVAQGVVYTCAGMFQALGRTLLVFVSALTQLGVFAAGLPLFLAKGGGADPAVLWEWASASLFIQACVSLLLAVPLWRAIAHRAI